MNYNDGRTYMSLSEKEIERRAKLTPKEQQAVDALVAAIKALPKSLTLDVVDYDDETARISKRITRGSSQVVASVKKKSLVL